MTNIAFDLSQGHHFDYKNHNFMLLDEYIGLSFSFMNLVIRDKHQNIDPGEIQDFQMDIEQFNYNINMKTFLSSDNFVIYNYDDLEKALAFIKQRDPELLE